MQEKEKLPQVLLLGESETAIALDRRALRDAGYGDIRVMSSGLDACRRLAGIGGDPYKPDLVVCTSRLADMDGDQFCAIVRQHPRLLALPILIVLPNENEAAQLKALGCGASALLGRPYSIEDLRRILGGLLAGRAAMENLRKAADQTDTAAFDAALASYGLLLRPSRQPEDYFRAGMRFLEENRYNYAISAFQRALENVRIKGEAELGIAAAYKGKGDTARYHAWLARAAETFIQARRWHHARSAFARLLQDNSEAKNPFLIEASRQIRHHEYNEAAKTLAEGCALIPSLKAGQAYAKVCLGADDAAAMFKALQAELASHGNGDFLAGEIRQSIIRLGKERQERMRQAADERQVQLARNLSAAKVAESAANAKSQPTGQQGPNPAILLEDEARASSGAHSVIPEHETSPESLEDKANEDGKSVLAPLTQPEATSDLFSGKPRINEFLSVIKLTWKLARRQKKQK